MNSAICYVFEVIFHLTKKHIFKNERCEGIYIGIIFLNIFIAATYGIYANGWIRYQHKFIYYNASFFIL